MQKDFAKKLAGIPETDRWRSFLINTAKMLVTLLVTVLLTEMMRSLQLGNQNLTMIYLLAVLVISFMTPSYGYGIVAALLCTLAYDFLVTPPRFGFSITIGSPVTLVIMLLVTVVTSTITTQIKDKARVAIEREKRAKLMYEINRGLLAARDLDTIVRISETYVSTHLCRSAMLYVRDPSRPEAGCCTPPDEIPPERAVFFTQEQIKRVHRIFKLGLSETERPVDDSGYDVYNLPVAFKGKVLAVVGVDCKGASLCPNELTLLQMMSGQLALALELQCISDERSNIVVEAEKEKMRGTLLRSISHDLRTPLTSILGASSTILEQKGDLDEETLTNLVKDIKLDAQWLIRMVENILIITRISGDTLRVSKTPEAAEEVISEAVSIVRKRFPDYIIHVHSPEELLLVPMDATLISQVLINLLENAVKSSPDRSLILVDLKKQDGYAQFDVSDNGSGIPEHLLDNLFEVHSPTKEQAVDSSRGMGIGLSICKTIIQAHGGQIEGHNRAKNGAKFSFRLPLHTAAEPAEPAELLEDAEL